MAIRLSGLTSGMDTDAIVQELVSAYSKKTEKYEKQQTKLTWKQDAWKGLNTKIYSLYTSVSNMRMAGTYNLRKTTLSDNTKATVTANSDAVTGTQKLNILQTAQASYITGGKLGDDVTTDTKMSDLGYKGGNTSFEVEGNDGEKHEIKVTKTTTVKEVIDQLKEAGLNASFDSNNKRIFISAKESGTANDFNLYGTDQDGRDVLEALGLNTALTTKDENGNIIFTEAGKAKYQEGYDLYMKAANAGMSVKDYIDSQIADYKALQSSYNQLKIKSSEYEETIGKHEVLLGELKALEDKRDAGDDSAELAEQIAAKQAEIEASSEGYELAKAELETNKTQMSELNTQMKEHEYGNMIRMAVNEEELTATVAHMVSEAEEAYAVYSDAASAVGNATKITGQDAVIKLNGVEFTSATNSFSINGITINAQAVTGDGDTNAVTITTNVDTQGIYDKIKDFLTEYNNVINEMTKLYNAESASDYEPLTDEEKEAMSEEQIEKWEDKIKSSLLRRDGNLNSIISAMVNSVSQSYEVDGEKLSLGSFGISTLGFLNSAKDEQYALHIDGDEDDENTSGKKDKLMKAIEENPDQLMGFMQKLMGNLYESIDKKMKSTELSSAYKVYNDKEMDKEAVRIEQMIKKWEDKISDKEEYYYDKFTQMEVALSKLQSQTSSISGLLGGMQ
ncbi:MAG: flagellar filament capping protein FliD [Agathobacter sp.]|nr:flagellar filament capping protein FliD [Agathobacter sp.]MBQ6812861.1 flagellar filament capping protein FliD [Agathobacter sp.]